MSERDYFPTGIKHLRIEALLSQRALADALGIAQSYIGTLELGRANPRLSMAYKILVVFARALERSPKEIWETLYIEETCAKFEPIRERAQLAFEGVERSYHGSFSAKRFLRDRDENGLNLALPDAADVRRLQRLFAMSPYTITEVARLSGISKRRLDLLFGAAPEPFANMTLTVFSTLVAILTPVYGASIQETAIYVLERDLEQLKVLV